MEILFLVQIKSKSITLEGKKALLITMGMEKEEIESVEKSIVHNALIRDAIKLYPQYTKAEDEPSFSISIITKKEHRRWNSTNVLKQKAVARGVK